MSDEAIKFYELFLNNNSVNKFVIAVLTGKYIKVGGDYFVQLPMGQHTYTLFC